jgi:hypothetical protein
MGNVSTACRCESTGGESGAVFSLLASQELQAFHARITELGVKKTEHLHMLTDADLERIGMKLVQRQLLEELIAQINISTSNPHVPLDYSSRL